MKYYAERDRGAELNNCEFVNSKRQGLRRARPHWKKKIVAIRREKIQTHAVFPSLRRALSREIFKQRTRVRSNDCYDGFMLGFIARSGSLSRWHFAGLSAAIPWYKVLTYTSIEFLTSAEISASYPSSSVNTTSRFWSFYGFWNQTYLPSWFINQQYACNVGYFIFKFGWKLVFSFAGNFNYLKTSWKNE